jgi:electron transfer flavoprotein beta subunit
MKVIAAIKQVPVRDSGIRIDSRCKWFDEQDLSYEINEPDAYALEAALLLKDRHGGEVVAVCAGPERAGSSIREALAKGADRAIHVVCDDLPGLDSLSLGRRLAAAAKAENADLIVTGLQSDDLGLGQTGVIMADALGIPHATIIMEIQKQDGSIRVKRELEDGWFQWLELPLPALLTIQSGISKLRYATLMGIKKAKTKEVRRVEAQALPAARGAPVSVERVYAPPRKKTARMIAGSAMESAAQLAEILKFEVRVL